VDRRVDIPRFRRLKPLAECRLYTFVDTAYLGGRDPRQVARELCAGGADIIQLRAKSEPAETVERIAQGLLPITRAAGVWLVINDHVAVALRVGAPACHLGQEDFFDAGHRAVSGLTPAGSPLSVGLSSHAPDQATRAVAAGAHYVAIGPVFATGTKPAARPVTLDYVRWAAAQIQVPWFAIGGITLDNVSSVLAAGAQRICVVSAILNSTDITAACRAFRAKLEK
jgi:thiamine-phosphate pyrophosphorylase